MNYLVKERVGDWVVRVGCSGVVGCAIVGEEVSCFSPVMLSSH